MKTNTANQKAIGAPTYKLSPIPHNMINPDLTLEEAYAATGLDRMRAVKKIGDATKTNRARAQAGHPSAPCQLTGEEAEALHLAIATMGAMIIGHVLKGGHQG